MMKKIFLILISIIIWYSCSDGEQEISQVSGVVSSTFLDERDQSVYKCITIDGQTWMAENLHYRLPWGSYEGCYSYMEEQADTTDFYADGIEFSKQVKEALNNGDITDPDPTMKMYLRFVERGAWSVSDYNDIYVDIPEIYAYLEKVRKELEMESINVVAVDFLEKAEKKNGGYKDKYGFLYTYEAAKTALPKGWRLPTDEDWKKLERALGMDSGECGQMEAWRGSTEGGMLKEEIGSLGFDIYMGGGKIYGVGGIPTKYQNRMMNAYFWSATETKMDDKTDVVIIRKFQYNEDRIFRGTSKIGQVAYSVRGIKE